MASTGRHTRDNSNPLESTSIDALESRPPGNVVNHQEDFHFLMLHQLQQTFVVNTWNPKGLKIYRTPGNRSVHQEIQEEFSFLLYSPTIVEIFLRGIWQIGQRSMILMLYQYLSSDIKNLQHNQEQLLHRTRQKFKIGRLLEISPNQLSFLSAATEVRSPQAVCHRTDCGLRPPRACFLREILPVFQDYWLCGSFTFWGSHSGCG